ncbi:2-hydroxyacid dehydrogenase [Roseiconus lacunae]|uniref:2-hydroxyacid dehydrogenase n=1 Tax=Roseiconus lacunae TaxID=2605694 RepID=UPI002AA5CC0B
MGEERSGSGDIDMRVAVFSTKSYDKEFLESANEGRHELTFLETRLTGETAALASGHDAVCLFVNDEASGENLQILADLGVRLITLRSAGFNHVDLEKADERNLTVARVPAYSPHAVAEHTVALMLTLNRKIHRAHNRVREANFSLEGLLGFDMRGRTVGVVGTGVIGQATIKILQGFGCHVIAYDPFPSDDADFQYVDLPTLFSSSDIITLHCPLTPETFHLIDAESIAQMQRGVMLINTSRGALVETQAVIDGLKRGDIGYLGLDVYEEEADLFFENLSGDIIQDDQFMRLTTFPNVVITGHQAFFTEEALSAIAKTTLNNVSDFETGEIPEKNIVSVNQYRR